MRESDFKCLLMLTYSMSFILLLTIDGCYPKCLSVSVENWKTSFILKCELRCTMTSAAINVPSPHNYSLKCNGKVFKLCKQFYRMLKDMYLCA